MPAPGDRLRAVATALLRWVDSHAGPEQDEAGRRQVDWQRTVPFIFLHLGCLAVFWVGWSSVASLAAALPSRPDVRDHRFLPPLLLAPHLQDQPRLPVRARASSGRSSAQRGPLWWAAHHRHHHKHPTRARGHPLAAPARLLWSHIGWITARAEHRARDSSRSRTCAKYPELRLLDRYDILVPVLLAASCSGLARALERCAPRSAPRPADAGLGLLRLDRRRCCHVTFCINSLAHVWGAPLRDRRRQPQQLAARRCSRSARAGTTTTTTTSGSARQGFYWWEIDLTYYVLSCCRGPA